MTLIWDPESTPLTSVKVKISVIEYGFPTVAKFTWLDESTLENVAEPSEVVCAKATLFASTNACSVTVIPVGSWVKPLKNGIVPIGAVLPVDVAISVKVPVPDKLLMAVTREAGDDTPLLVTMLTVNDPTAPTMLARLVPDPVTVVPPSVALINTIAFDEVVPATAISIAAAMPNANLLKIASIEIKFSLKLSSVINLKSSWNSF